MISKELLSVVLGIPLAHIRYNDTTNLYKIFKEYPFNWSDGSYGRWSNLEVNIYELAHKCKEWALEHDCELLSCIRSKDRSICDIYSDKYNCKFTHYADTEPEAIFKATSYIMEQLKQKD